ncbi:MAG: HD-GYP domain-containing protein, partial [Phycisphaerales bacterium JB059]
LIDEALVAVNAAFACRRLYGEEHPAISMHARRAAELIARAVGARPLIRVVLLEGKVVCEGGSLPSSDALASGAFARLGRDLPDCLDLDATVTGTSILGLIETLGGGAAPSPLPGVRFRWLNHDGDDAEPDAPVVIADARFMSHELRTAWDQTVLRGQAPVKAIEALAGDVVAAVSAGSATVLPMADLKGHDEYTYVHAINVGVMSSALARAVGLSPERVFHITCAALLHDVGKGAIPLEIVNKKGPLDEQERARMNDHPAEGAAILAASPGLSPVAVSVAYEHHMKLDGGGYPTPPRGWRVGLASQVVHIADVFDALRTHRPYREALPMQRTLEILGEESGVAFDAELYRVFVEHVLRVTPDRAGASERTPEAA